MSNRLIRDSICSSDTIDELTWFEEVFFYRLIVNCDDFGRTDARPAILKANLFPLKSTTISEIEKTLNRLSAVGLIYRYKVNDRPYLQLVTWEKYQQIRSKKSKFPAPDEGEPVSVCEKTDNTCKQMISNAIKCEKVKSNAPVIQSNPIQSESETKSESINKPGADKSASVQKQPSVISLILNDKSLYDITQEQIDHWGELYPAVDVMQELRSMKGWLESNPAKRKTSRGILRFITSWLSRAQDKGGASYGNAAKPGGTVTKSPIYGNVF